MIFSRVSRHAPADTEDVFFLLARLDCAGSHRAHLTDRGRWLHAEFNQKPGSDRPRSSEPAAAMYQDVASAAQQCAKLITSNYPLTLECFVRC